MPLGDHHKANFQMMCTAIRNGDACIMECFRKGTREPVVVVCMAQQEGDNYMMIPVAKLFDDNPYEEIDPPLEAEVITGGQPQPKN